MFEEEAFSFNRLKHIVSSSLLFWVGIIPNVDIGKVLAFHKVDPPLYFSSPFLLYSLDGGYIFDAHNRGIYEWPFTSLHYTFIYSLIGTH